MMSKKMRVVAVVVILVMVLTVIVYPLIFGTDPQSEDNPVTLELEN